MKDSLRNDPRYKSVKHEDREIMFNEYISELKFAEEEAERVARAKQEEQVANHFLLVFASPLSLFFLVCVCGYYRWLNVEVAICNPTHEHARICPLMTQPAHIVIWFDMG